MTGTVPTPTFRLAYVPGVTPAKWVRTWGERLPQVPLELVAVTAAEARTTLVDAQADAGLVRLPVDRDRLSAIPLYAETTVVVVPKDHELTAAEEVTPEDLGDYIVLHPMDDCLEWETLPGRPAISRPETTADAIELVAAGIGVLLVPQSLARLHHRKDLTYRTMTGVPESQVALSWPEGGTSDLVEEFIGIVRGRTVNSSRGRGAQEAAAAAKTGKTGKTAKTAKSANSAKSAVSNKSAKAARTAKTARSANSAKPRRHK
ncbi:LysR family substrate-binding domain-containing protein [Catenulispora rubra]|uniref:LysR family substrate-binding domain-containing protein n=1 Tax=Catenulispora rubra TaxID=280293 RepID=UPI00189208C0|nr:LysR family substrate-binding domain-containing protein [Catenulispora rubra]